MKKVHYAELEDFAKSAFEDGYELYRHTYKHGKCGCSWERVLDCDDSPDPCPGCGDERSPKSSRAVTVVAAPIHIMFKRAYSREGAGGVCDLANKNPTRVWWGHCKGCDADTPALKCMHDCLVCGNPVEPNEVEFVATNPDRVVWNNVVDKPAMSKKDARARFALVNSSTLSVIKNFVGDYIHLVEIAEENGRDHTDEKRIRSNQKKSQKNPAYLLDLFINMIDYVNVETSHWQDRTEVSARLAEMNQIFIHIFGDVRIG